MIGFIAGLGMIILITVAGCASKEDVALKTTNCSASFSYNCNCEAKDNGFIKIKGVTK